MGQDNGKAVAGRSPTGQFSPGNPGGPGRTPGSENKGTIDARKLRCRLLESWDRIEGDKLLDAFARENFGDYLKIVVKLLPKELDVDAPELARRFGHPPDPNGPIAQLRAKWAEQEGRLPPGQEAAPAEAAG